MRTPQPPPREVPSHLLSFQVPLLTGTSPAGLCVRIVSSVTERSGQASQGSEQGGPGATGQNDRALWRDSCMPGASEGRPAETESGAPEPRVRGWEPRGPAPSPQHRGPASCSIRRAIPTHGPWRNFMALHSPGDANTHMGVLGPSRLPPSQPHVRPGLAWQGPRPHPCPFPPRCTPWDGLPPQAGWRSCCKAAGGPGLVLNTLTPFHGRGLLHGDWGPVGSGVHLWRSLLMPSPPQPRRAWAFHTQHE